MNRRVLFIGGPRTGKSNLWAALYTVASDLDASEWRIGKIPKSASYLEKLSAKWVACEELPRTSMGDDTWLEVEFTNGSKTLGMQGFDKKGEQFHQLLEDDHVSDDLLESARKSRTWVIFAKDECAIPPSDLKDSTPEEQGGWKRPLAYGHLDEDIEGFDDKDESVEGTEESTEAAPWTKKGMCSDLKHVLMLQRLLKAAGRPPKRVILALSAWDQIDTGLYSTANTWFVENAPLLCGYLEKLGTTVEFVGISAQGGSYANEEGRRTPEIKADLQEKELPSRCQVVKDGTSSNDITTFLDMLSA